MTSSDEPVGRLPKSVYRRRRLFVLIGVLAVIAIIILVIWRPGSSSGEPAARVTPLPASTSSSTPSSTPTPEATAEEAPAEVIPCTDKEVTVEALADKNTYAAGELPQFSLRITNTSAAPCTINVGTTQQVLTVTSGAEQYWTSTDCQTEPVDAVVDLAAGQSVTSSAPVVWDRTRSATDTCAGERPAVPAGGASYHLSTSVAGIDSASTTQFLLR